MSLWNGSSLIKRVLCFGHRSSRLRQNPHQRRFEKTVLGLDNFYSYYNTTLKRAHQQLCEKSGIFIVEGGINDAVLLNKLFEVLHGNIAGFVSILEVCKNANPQPAIVWASSSSVRKRPNRSTPPASLYVATKKAGEEISHMYNHIYGLLLTGLRFFTVNGPWGRPDMAYFFLTKDILKGNRFPFLSCVIMGSLRVILRILMIL
ncbi:putative UDP-glucuronate 4-epimerase [Helianthus annuus]|nr:putative UDP-glucuronate 4-epimerase [Helianthus annuus]